jgi:hypothetical protein
MEFKQQIGQAVAYTVRNGDIVNERKSVKIFVRDCVLRLIQLVLIWKLKLKKLLLGSPQYTYESGMAFLPSLGGGISFPQICCRPIPQAGDANVEVIYSDDAIFASEKRGLFPLVVLTESVAEVSTVADILDGILPVSEDIKKLIHWTTYVVHGTEPVSAADSSASLLSKGSDRAPQESYDESSLKKFVNGEQFVIEHFVFAACADHQELEQASGEWSTC